MNLQTCGICGDVLRTTTCDGCARRDYEGMRDMQAKFIKADHERRELLLQIEEKNRALFNIINVIGPTSAAKCEGCLFEMEEALRIARAAYEDKTEKRKCANRKHYQPCDCGDK